MNLLVLGSGGREHALAWKLAQSDSVSCVYVAPGNAGTAMEDFLHNVNLDIADFGAVATFVRQFDVGMVVVGPEVPLVNGIRDYMDHENIACFGPSKAAAQLEGSKTFSKEFLVRHGIPTARFESFTELEPALAYLEHSALPVVIKADGLAAGKGVVVALNARQAQQAVTDMLAHNTFGEAGHRVLIEEFLEGEEASFICLCDGTFSVAFASSQDHKARDDGDKGPNTGGMGAYSPAPIVNEEVAARIMREVIEPTVKGMSDEGMPYQGFLYAGLMVAADGSVRVIEFNCRFGDPEAQPVLMRLQSDLYDLLRKSLAGELKDALPVWDENVTLGVVMAAGGYPGNYQTGCVITGLTDTDVQADTKVFHAGTRTAGTEVLTNGGRVLCVVGRGRSTLEAQSRAYARIASITWKDAYYRTDIGYRAISHEKK